MSAADELAELRALSDAATDGEWSAGQNPDDSWCIAVPEPAAENAVTGLFDADWGTEADARLAAAAVNYVRSRLAAIPGAPSTDPAPEPPTCSNCGTPIIEGQAHRPANLGVCYSDKPAPPAPEDGEA